jgi:uncharacterized protein with LGFP repeats
MTEIQGCPDGEGSFQHFQNGSIYFHPTTGTHEVHGMIRDKWAGSGWETFLGYPMTDETATPDGVGRYNHFRRLDGGETSIYWTPQTGANVVSGEIRRKWADLGWETLLGYPMTDETATPDGVGRYNTSDGSMAERHRSTGHRRPGPTSSLERSGASGRNSVGSGRSSATPPLTKLTSRKVVGPAPSSTAAFTGGPMSGPSS